MTPLDKQYIAKDAVREWIEDGMELCYIHERADVNPENWAEIQEIYQIATEIIGEFRV